MRVVCTALTALALVLCGGRCRASEGRTSSLSWLRLRGADSCVATQTLARAVEERLGRHVFVSAAEADVSVEGHIEKRANAWHAAITVRDARGAVLGTRDLDRTDPSCDVMTEPLALVIAVMIDPEAGLTDHRKDPAPPAPVPPAAASPPAVPSAAASSAAAAVPPDEPPRRPARVAEPWRFEAAGNVTVASGLGPSLAAGGGLGAILYPPGIPVGFRGFTALFLPTHADQDGARASFDMLYVGGEVCPTWRTKHANVLGCLGGHLGLLRSTAETQNRGIEEAALPLWNAVAELRSTLRLLAPIELTGGVGLVVPLLRPSFEYTTSPPGGGRAALHRVAAVGFEAELGLGFFFP